MQARTCSIARRINSPVTDHTNPRSITPAVSELGLNCPASDRNCRLLQTILPMNNDILDIFTESLSRCTKDPKFMDVFYQKFIGESERVKEHFKNTDMEKQKRMLLHSLANMVIAYERPEILHDVAVKHDARHLNIMPDLYVNWLECLIQAAEITDPMFSREVERSWRIVMQNGIDYLISKRFE